MAEVSFLSVLSAKPTETTIPTFCVMKKGVLIFREKGLTKNFLRTF